MYKVQGLIILSLFNDFSLSVVHWLIALPSHTHSALTNGASSLTTSHGTGGARAGGPFPERSGGTVKRWQGQGLLWAVTCRRVPSAHSTLFFQAPFCPCIPSLQTRNPSYSTLYHITIHPPPTRVGQPYRHAATALHTTFLSLSSPIALPAVLAWPLEKAEGKCLPEQILIRTF